MQNKKVKYILCTLSIISAVGLMSGCGINKDNNDTVNVIQSEEVIESETVIESEDTIESESTDLDVNEEGKISGYETEVEDTTTEEGNTEFDNMTSEEKSDANYNDSQSGNDEEQIFEEEPAEPEVPEVPTEPEQPEQPEVEKPSTSGTPGNYNFSAEERQYMKDAWGLSDSEIDSMTKERFHELIFKDTGIDLSGSHSSSGNSSGSSSSGGGSSATDNEIDTSTDPSLIPQLTPPEPGKRPGSM